MGYDTRYSLEVVHPETREALPLRFGGLVIAVLRARNEEAHYCLDETGSSDETGKWYAHEVDLRQLSKENPHFLFVLSGEGEEAGDVWKKYFLAGKCQVAKAQIQIAEFDRAQLS